MGETVAVQGRKQATTSMKAEAFKPLKQHVCRLCQSQHRQDLTITFLGIGRDKKAACFYAFIILHMLF